MEVSSWLFYITDTSRHANGARLQVFFCAERSTRVKSINLGKNVFHLRELVFLPSTLLPPCLHEKCFI